MMDLIGKENVDFVDQNGKRVQGIKLHVVAKDVNVQGTAALNQFFDIRHSLYDKACRLELGKIDVQFSIRGVMQDIFNVK